MIRNILYDDFEKFIKLINININKVSFELFINNLNPNRHIIIVYEKDNEIIGTGSLLIEPKLTYNISYLGHIENIFVETNYRNKGVGKEIVEYLVNYSREKLCYRIDLACEDRLIKFYKELGFNKQLICMSMLIEENFK
jgi:glucosamine-phosphate N-acetyltransferase